MPVPVPALAVAFLLAAAGVAAAGVHPRFEPTDLELEQSGVTEIDLQLGPVKGQGAARLVVPDFEVDLGLLSWLELDVDGAFGVEGAGPKRFFDHGQRENLWTSAKVRLYDHPGADDDHSWALGAQVGPKLPVSNGASGIGVEGLLLLGQLRGPAHVVYQLGGLVDPRTAGAGRPTGVEAGVDLQYDLVPNRWAILGEVGGIWYRSDDPSQLAVTAGIQFSPSEQLDLSVVALVGILSGSDPYGVLFGVSPKFALW